MKYTDQHSKTCGFPFKMAFNKFQCHLLVCPYRHIVLEFFKFFRTEDIPIIIIWRQLIISIDTTGLYLLCRFWMMDRSSLLASRIYRNSRSLIYNIMFKLVDRKLCSSWMHMISYIWQLYNNKNSGSRLILVCLLYAGIVCCYWMIVAADFHNFSSSKYKPRTFLYLQIS